MPKVSKSKKGSNKIATPTRQKTAAIPEKAVIEEIAIAEEGISTEATHNYEAAKKDYKKKARHEAWLEKLDHAYAVKKKQQKKENKKKTGFKADLSDFNDVLSSIKVKPKSELASKATHGKKMKEPTPQPPAIPSNKLRSKKSKKSAEMQEILRMQKVMQHNAFKTNPLATIHQHVQNTFF